MYILQSIKKEQQIRRKAFNETSGNNLKLLVNDLSTLDLLSYKDDLIDFYQFLLSFKYHHPGLTQEAYMSHPIRVARLCISYLNTFSLQDLKLSLAHNILELTDIDPSNIKRQDLLSFLPTIQILTVDRKLQWDKKYKNYYYENISKSDSASRIKVLDKLDNLYVLEDNPDTEVINLYLDEIEDFILPLAVKYVPKVITTIQALVIYNRNKII